MKYNYDYNTELKNILDKIYEAKIYDIIKKYNFNNINENNIEHIINKIKSTSVYLGSDFDDFIINLIPTEDSGYFFRCEIANHFNYSYPRLFDYLGNPLKNISCTKYAIRLWESSMEDLLIDDVRNNFNQEDFNNFVENNFKLLYKDIINTINNEKLDIIIPVENKSNLIITLKSMILNNELDSSFIDLLVDINKVRNHMERFVVSTDMYNEFDMIEDSLERCIDEFPKYTSEELYDILVNEHSYIPINGIGLVKKQ